MPWGEISRILYPKIDPYKTGFLNVDNEHQLYYEECGNPNGYPLLFIHGGPGAGCREDDRRFFDPEKWRIILFDQRGCGRSRPLWSLANNTTQHLVQDSKMLLDHLAISKAVYFGGSWGSTLALVTAITYPETVSGLVLRGIFLGSAAEVCDYISGIPAEASFPELFERFLSQVPEKARSHPGEYYYQQMTSNDPARRKHFADEWTVYGQARLMLQPPSIEEVEKDAYNDPTSTSAVLEAHYFRSNCFLKDNFIIQNSSRLSGIPTVIVQGRYDVLCTPSSAYRLSKALPEAKLCMTIAGHYSRDPENCKALVDETNHLFDKLRP